MSEAYLNLGMLLLDKEEDAAAVAPLRKAVELLPAQSRPRYLLAVALDRSGNHAALPNLSSVNPSGPQHITPGLPGWRLERQVEEAEARFRRALKFNRKV